MCACLQSTISVPNPYAIEQGIVLAILVGTSVLWARVRPPAVRVLRVAAMFAALFTSLAMVASSLGEYSTVEPECRLALQGSLVLAGCLAAELIGGWQRERIPRAIARWLR